jgi:cytochrome c oxidase cbb3-type subunit III
MKYIFKNISQNTGKRLKYFFTFYALLSGLSVFAGNTSEVEDYNSLSIFANPLFLVLLGTIILLMIIISVLGGVLTNVAESVKDRSKSGTIVPVLAFLIFSSSAKQASAESFFSVSQTSTYMGLSAGLFYLLLAVIVFELIIITVLLGMIRLLAKSEKEEKEVALFQKAEPTLLEKLNASVSIEKEADIMLDHNYDGIRELDNDLPPWWKYGFYATIVFAFVYLIHYHVFQTGKLQIAEYDYSIEVAKKAKEDAEKNNANNVTENTVKLLTDKDQIAKGASVFMENCIACHGKLGEGGVGPNLTDDYWLHGGGIKDIFKTIKYGWPEKGMKSWQADLSPIQINQIASFIKSIHGTNPPNGKEKQGDLYSENGVVPNATIADSLNTITAAKDTVVNASK